MKHGNFPDKAGKVVLHKGGFVTFSEQLDLGGNSLLIIL